FVLRRRILVAQRRCALDGVGHLRRDRLYFRDDGLGRLGNLVPDRLDDAFFVSHGMSHRARCLSKDKVSATFFAMTYRHSDIVPLEFVERMERMRENRSPGRFTRRGLLSAAGAAGAGIALPGRILAAEPAKPDP